MEMNFDFMNETRRGDGTGKGSRPGSGTPGLSFRSTAIKLYSGVKFYDVKKTSSRPSSRASVTSKSSHMSKMGLNTVRLGSIASKLKQPKPTKIHVQQPNPTKVYNVL